MKRHAIILCSILITALCLPLMTHAAKTVKIRLTGDAKEKILMTIGDTGRSEIIGSLPYTFELAKDQLPIRLTFQSDNYVYYNIDVPKKPFDDAGHVYLVKIDEFAMSVRNSNQINNQQAQHSSPNNVINVTGPDLSKGVNNAPVTGKKNENTLALIIANENYELAAKVDNATNDGIVFKEYCLKTLGLPSQNVKYFKDLTFGRMKKAISDILEVASIMGEDAALIIYYAGHGIPDNNTKNAFLMPVDSDGSDTDVCLSLSGLYDSLNNTGLRHCMVFLDACFSGAQRDGEMIMAARGVKLRPKEDKPKGNTIVFSATSGEEAAYSYKEEEHGLFTYFLLKKLQESKGNVTLGELSEYLTKNVGIQSRLINNNGQTPTVHVSATLNDQWKSIKFVR